MNYKFRFFILLTALLGLVFSFQTMSLKAEPMEPATPESDPNWNTAVTLSTGDSGARLPAISAAPNNGNKLIVAYVSQRSGVEENTDPYYRISNNNGGNWTSPAPINSNTNTTTSDIDIAIDSSGNAHALWVEITAANARQLRYSKQTNWPNGAQTRASVNDPGVISFPRIVTSGANRVDIVWAQDNSGILTDIYHARSTDGGTNWNISGVVVDNSGTSQSPDIAVNANGKIFLVWTEGFLSGQVYYAEGTVSGNSVSWTVVTNLSSKSLATNAVEPKILLDGNTVKVTYTNRLNESTQYVHYLECTSNCVQISNWKSVGNPISGTALGANVGDPFDVNSTLGQAGRCTYVYFHGVRSGSNNEQILGVNSCSGWGTSPQDEITTVATRALNPELAIHNNWWIYLEKKKKGTPSQIKFIRNIPAVYLPLIVK